MRPPRLETKLSTPVAAGRSLVQTSESKAATLVFSRPLREGESLTGYVQWLCVENVVPRQTDLFKLLSRLGCASIRSTHELAQDEGALRTLELVTGQSAGALSHLHFRVLRAAVDEGEERRIVQHGYEWPQGSRAVGLQAVCPECLREDGFIHADWEFVQAPVCTRHQTQLVDHCGACGEPVRLSRPVLAHCESCEAPLSDVVTVAVDAPAAAATRLVQTPRMLAFGSETYTVPLEPQELSGLLRLLLIPHFGEDESHGLRGNLEAIAIARRVDALRRLGSSLVGARIDSDRVRTLAQQRWPYAPLLVADEQVRLMEEAARAAGLPPDVTRMLCWGSDAEHYPSATEVLGSSPPRILTTRRLADYLGLEPQFLPELLGLEHISASKPADFGFDMDDVLRLERVLRSMPTIEQVDETLGWPGITDELLNMRLLQPLRGPGGMLGIYPPSLSRLLERIRGRIGAASCSECTAVSLRTARELGFDARRFAWVVAQVVGGTLTVLDWEAPFNLPALRVCGRRLRDLARWPQSETSSSRGCATRPEILLSPVAPSGSHTC